MTMETIGDYISFISLLVFGIWIGSLFHTYYMRQILSELKKLNQSTPSDPKTIPPNSDPKTIPPNLFSNWLLMFCSDCDTGYRGKRTDCPKCGGTNRYQKKSSGPSII